MQPFVLYGSCQCASWLANAKCVVHAVNIHTVQLSCQKLQRNAHCSTELCLLVTKHYIISWLSRHTAIHMNTRILIQDFMQLLPNKP
jgi:hypothetical protein